MKITLEHYGNKVSVETTRDDLTIIEVWERLIEPTLLGAGFSQGTIESLFDNGEKNAS